MFRVKKSIPVEADLQGYIHFASRRPVGSITRPFSNS